jgi:hypothetical protein
MATKRAPIPMRMKVRAGERGSMDYDGSINQGIELAFYYLSAKRRGDVLAALQKTHDKLMADEKAAPAAATIHLTRDPATGEVLGCDAPGVKEGL